MIAAIGLVLGFVAGFAMPVVPSVAYARYLSIAVLASLDSALGGLRASLEGKYDNAIFVTGFFTNIFLAAGLIFVGDRLGVRDLYLAAVAGMGIRLFQNMGIIRRLLFQRWGVIRPETSREEPGQSSSASPRAPSPPQRPAG